MDKHSEYVATMEKQLKQWDADVDALTARGEKASAEARAAYQLQLKGLRANRDAAQKSFEQMRLASEAAGKQMQAGMETAYKTMQDTLKKVSSDLAK